MIFICLIVLFLLAAEVSCDLLFFLWLLLLLAAFSA